MSPPRIAPLPHPAPDPRAREALERWMPPGSGVEPLRLFRTLVTHPELAAAMWPLGRHILGRSSRLSLPEREILILRTCALSGCEYEWGVHVTGFAARAGLDADAVAATVHGGPDAACWSPAEAALLRALDELHAGPRLSDASWTALRAHHDAPTCLEILAAAGWYRTIATLCNGLALPPEPWAARFPARADAPAQREPAEKSA